MSLTHTLKMPDISSKNSNFKFSEVIGQGSFSTVLRIWNKNTTKRFTTKTALKEEISPKERQWGQLHLKNILNLLNIQYLT